MFDNTQALLVIALQAAVPLWVHEIKNEPWDRLVERAHRCAQIVAEKGDIIMFKSEKRGETAKAFNALAEGVACLSFAPGGVTIFGCHFETKYHHPRTPVRRMPVLSLLF